MSLESKVGHINDASEGSKLKPEQKSQLEKAEQGMAEHIKDIPEDSTRFVVMNDLIAVEKVDLELDLDARFNKREEVEETYRQHIRKFDDYTGEFERFLSLVNNYRKVINKVLKPRNYAEAQDILAKGLEQIKTREIERRSQQPQTPPQP